MTSQPNDGGKPGLPATQPGKPPRTKRDWGEAVAACLVLALVAYLLPHAGGFATWQTILMILMACVAANALIKVIFRRS